MPSAYAHYTFGKKVYAELPLPVKRLISQNRQAYSIGLQGPDILFYYHPWGKNSISRTGSQLHHQLAAGFFEEGRRRFSETGNVILFSYLLGFVCHFMLDSSCHPYIGEKVEERKTTHHEIESEFDRMLMLLDEKDPFTFNPTGYMSTEDSLCAAIAEAFPAVTKEQVRESILSCKMIHDISICDNTAKRAFSGSMTTLVGLKGLVLPKEPNSLCEESNKELFWLYQSAVEETAEILLGFYYACYNGAPLNPRFMRTYS